MVERQILENSSWEVTKQTAKTTTMLGGWIRVKIQSCYNILVKNSVFNKNKNIRHEKETGKCDTHSR